MKLLTRAELKSDQTTSLDVLHGKEKELIDAITKKTKALNELNEIYDLRLSAKQSELKEAEAQFKRFIGSREEIVRNLEARRLAALEPVNVLLESAERIKVKVSEELEVLKERESDLSKGIEDWRKKYEKALKHESDARRILSETQQRCDLMEQKIESERKESNRLHQVAEETMKAAVAQKEELDALQASLEAEKRSNEAIKESILAEKKESIKEQDKLKDEREKLRMARIILEKKYGGRIT